MFFHILFFGLAMAQCVTERQCDEIRLNAEYWKPERGDAYNDADLIVPGLYLGNVCAAHSERWLSENNITLVISVAREWSVACRAVPTRYFDLDDTVTEDAAHVREILRETTGLITQHVKNGSVLVHCNMGISRSSTAVLAYLQAKYPRKSYQRLLRMVRARRPVVRLNALFGQLLTEPELRK